MNERIQFSLTADGDHSYFQKSPPKSDPVQELWAQLQSMDLEVQQEMGGEGRRRPCRASRMPRPAGGGLRGPQDCIWGGSIRVHTCVYVCACAL